VSNRRSHRNILFLDDLAHYVLKLVALKTELPPILNTGSLNTSIGDLADAIATYHGVPVIDKGNSVTYSFRMDCEKIETLCGAPHPATIAERCARFQNEFRVELQAAS
jgi:nucleoside-diphosphate-sugar epimerase